MISFQGRNEVLKNADRITRSVNSIYPHISESRAKDYIEDELLYLDFDSKKSRKLQDLMINNSVKIDNLRFTMTSGMELFKNIIFALKNAKIGKCYEDGRLAEIIAKINGQENVYPMKLFVTRNSSGADIKLEHVVSVLTNKHIEPHEKYIFKNKDAIILDPWLGITEFVGKYLEKLKNDFCHHFYYMPDNDLSMRILSNETKNLKEFKAQRKEKCFNPVVKFLLHEDDILSKEQAKSLREDYPELVLDNFQKIVL